MRKNSNGIKAKWVLVGYIVISLIPPGLTFYGVYYLGKSEYGLSLHVYSLILSAPLGWLAHNYQPGSVAAICLSSVLGILQWTTVYAIYSFKANR